MRLLSGKRIGQSRPELAYAVLFSFFLHVIILFAAIFLHISATPMKYVPPFYQVKLVGQPVDIPQVSSRGPAGGAAPPVPKHEVKPAPKKSAVPQRVAKAAPTKGALPELTQPKQRPRKEEEVKPEESVKEQPTGPVGGPSVPGGGGPSVPGGGGPSVPGGGAASGVTVATAQPDFKFQYYINTVREKIGQHWRPPPDVKDAKARVTFTVNRSGWVGEVNLDTEHSSGTFGFKQAAIRAIRSSNPFPPLPDEFAKQSLEFSVDLMEKE